MKKHKATLIQDISEYLLLLKTHLEPLFQEYVAMSGVTLDMVIHWIINEELEQNYYLFTRSHRRDCSPQCNLYWSIKSSLPLELHRYTMHYIKAPKLYGDDTEVKTSVRGMDLYIEYYDWPVAFPNNTYKFSTI